MVKEKQQIVLVAFDLFSQYGIKSVSMDDIARNVGISKRTLYENFDDKETLLVEGMQYISGNLGKHLETLLNGSYNAVEVIILFYEEIMRRPRWYDDKFYEDMKKYPRAMAQKEKEKNDFIQKCTEIFHRGIKEDVFREEVNFEIVALLAKEQIKMIHPSKSFSKHSNTEVYSTVLITFLRGICTDKGLRVVEKWINSQKINHA